jgi:DNA-binding winged helix-turn-helix (wHTH) protein/TolB-like protein/Flp pilus assembly protein TadD
VEPTQPAAIEVLRFGIFELDNAAGELRRNGSLVRLPPQPFQVLQLLARNSGEVVDRDRIRREVWGETAVDFDRSLNVCIAQIRAALNDDADNPRFVQTLPRRGYRFLATLERPDAPAPLGTGHQSRRWMRVALAAGLAVVAAAAAGYRLSRPSEQAIRIAVLPFEIIGNSGEDNAQIEGLFDELLTRLSGVQPDRLRVIGRRSVARFRNSRQPLREIGERLNVRYAVEATVRMEGPQLRVTMRLAQADNETVLWSETFSQDADARAFEEDFVARVSAAVLSKLFPDAPPLLARESGCGQGWEAYRTGRLLANRGTIAGLEKSLSFFEQANCEASRVALADTLSRLARIRPRQPELWERVRSAARGVDAPAVHVSLGNVAFWRDWNWKTAEREFQAALRGNPSDPDAHHDFAWLLMALGRREEALASLQRAIALDPLAARIHMDSGWLLLQGGRYREAAAEARRALDLNPELKEARGCVYRALLYAGDYRGALEAIRGLASEEEMRAVAALPPAEAVRVLFRSSIRAKGTMDPYQRAWRLAWLGLREEALAEVEEAFRTRSSMMPLVAVDPAFASIRSEARFQKITRDMGL